MSFVKWIQRKRRSREENIFIQEQKQKATRSKSVDSSLLTGVNLAQRPPNYEERGQEKKSRRFFALRSGGKNNNKVGFGNSNAVQIPVINLERCYADEEDEAEDDLGESGLKVVTKSTGRRHSVGIVPTTSPTVALVAAAAAQTVTFEDGDDNSSYYSSRSNSPSPTRVGESRGQPRSHQSRRPSSGQGHCRRRRMISPSPNRILYSQYCDLLTAEDACSNFPQNHSFRRHSDTCQVKFGAGDSRLTKRFFT